MSYPISRNLALLRARPKGLEPGDTPLAGPRPAALLAPEWPVRAQPADCDVMVTEPLNR